MSGVRKTIYVPDDFDWDGLQTRAKDMGMSVSQLLLSDIDQLDRIESKLDGANEQLAYISGLVLGLASNRKEANPEKYESHRGAEIPVEKIKDDFINALADEDVDLEAEELKQANERLMKKRIETKKGPVKANAALENFFNPIPKAKWKGAK